MYVNGGGKAYVEGMLGASSAIVFTSFDNGKSTLQTLLWLTDLHQHDAGAGSTCSASED